MDVFTDILELLLPLLELFPASRALPAPGDGGSSAPKNKAGGESVVIEIDDGIGVCVNVGIHPPFEPNRITLNIPPDPGVVIAEVVVVGSR